MTLHAETREKARTARQGVAGQFHSSSAVSAAKTPDRVPKPKPVGRVRVSWSSADWNLFDSLRLETRQRTTGRDRNAEPSHLIPGTTGQTLAPTVPALFDQSVAAWLGIEMPIVGGGVPGYPVVSTNLTGGMKAKSAAAAETEGAITVTTATPKRLTGSFRITREDLAVLPTLGNHVATKFHRAFCRDALGRATA